MKVLTKFVVLLKVITYLFNAFMCPLHHQGSSAKDLSHFFTDDGKMIYNLLIDFKGGLHNFFLLMNKSNSLHRMHSEHG